MLLALILSLSVGPVLVTAVVCEWGFVRDSRAASKAATDQGWQLAWLKNLSSWGARIGERVRPVHRMPRLTTRIAIELSKGPSGCAGSTPAAPNSQEIDGRKGRAD